MKRGRDVVVGAALVLAAACSRDRVVHSDEDDWIPDAQTSPRDFPVATTPIHVVSFLDATHAPSKPLKKDPDDCLKAIGCPAVDPIPSCGAPSPTIWLAHLVADYGAFRDRRVSVRAPLQALTHFSTLVGCNCCNFVSGYLGMKEKLGSVLLWNASLPHRFDCNGDDSALCCGIDHDDGDVIATGVLREIPDALARDHFLPSFWILDDVEVCRPKS